MSNNIVQKNKKQKNRQPLNKFFPKYKEFAVFGIISFLFSFLISQNAAISIVFSELFVWLFFIPQLNSDIKQSKKLNVVLKCVFPIMVASFCFLLIGIDVFNFLIILITLIALLAIFKTTQPINCFVINIFVPFFLFLYFQMNNGSFLNTLKVFTVISENNSFFYLNDKFVYLLGVLLIFCFVNVLSFFIKTKKSVYTFLGFLILLFNVINLLFTYLLKKNIDFLDIKTFVDVLKTMDYLAFFKDNLIIILNIFVAFIIYMIIINKGMYNELIFAKRKKLIYLLVSILIIPLILFYLSKHDIYNISGVNESYFYYLLKPIFGIKIG